MSRITEFKNWPKGLEVSYHDWVIRASKTEIMEKLGFKPSYNKSGYKSHYQWKCSLDNGRYYFTIYDMSYGRKLGKDEVTEYHIGFDDNYDDIHNYYPKKIEAFDMLIALEEIGLQIDHASNWKLFHENGVIEDIERMVKNDLIKNEQKIS